MINFSGAQNLGINVGIFQLISKDSVNGAVKNFKYISVKGKQINSTNPNNFISHLMTEEKNEYKYLLGIVSLSNGVYELGISNPTNVFRKNNVCTKAAFTVNFTNTNLHSYYNKIIAPNVTLPNSGGNLYFFKVK